MLSAMLGPMQAVGGCSAQEMPPGTSALGFAKRLRDHETTSEIPIVMMTLNHTRPGMMSELDAEIGDHLAKSVCERELVARVKAAVLRAR